MPKNSKKPRTETQRTNNIDRDIERDPNRRLRAIVLAVQRADQTDQAHESSLQELGRLAGTLDIDVIEYASQKRDAPGGSYLGDGKLKEIAEKLPDHAEGPIDVVLIDDEITPGQQRTVAAALDLPVMDRSAVILRIFERRAQTPRAKLEVEIARLTYDLPRLRDADNVVDKQGGGAGRGERGHTNVELAKQQMRKRLSTLRSSLETLQDADDRRRSGARKQDTPRVALVGYTNAGKSSWMRALTGSHVLVEDKLFATLGVTTRPIHPDARPPILVTDTVGFIQRLPHDLVASFRSTLDQACDADQLWIVVDASDADFRAQLATTEETLRAIGASAPRHLLLNKIDRVPVATRLTLATEFPDAVQASAHDREDVTRVRRAMVDGVNSTLTEAVLAVPYAQAAFSAEIRASAHVIDEQHEETASVLRVRAPQASIARWKAALS